MARPCKEINQEIFENLCEIQCTEEEICNVLGVSDKTLSAWCKRVYNGKGFSEIYPEKRGTGKASLRRKQWNLANKNAAMAIFLGKQYLGQSDNPRDTSGDHADVVDDWIAAINKGGEQ